MARAKTDLRVLVDAHMVGARETGNETYVVNLLSNLAQNTNIHCAAAISSNNLNGELTRGLELLELQPPGDWPRLLYTLPKLCRDWRADLLHVTYVAPLWFSHPFVVSVHDVVYRRYPKFFSPKDRLLFATLLPYTLRRARAIITISEHARQEIYHFFPHTAGKVHVTYLAPSDLYRKITDLAAVAQVCAKYGIRQRFVLAVGNLQPRKNLSCLIRAFARVHTILPDVQLVIVGKAQWQSSAIYQTVYKLGVESHVLFTGYAPDEDLVLLYNAAALFVYPSLYEGFGLPILEAMACGTPVITSQTSSMPEVAGDAALLVDPYQEDQLAHAILRILTESDLTHRLAQRGQEQATRFSWQQTAQATVAVYQSVLAGVEM